MIAVSCCSSRACGFTPMCGPRGWRSWTGRLRRRGAVLGRRGPAVRRRLSRCQSRFPRAVGCRQETRRGFQIPANRDRPRGGRGGRGAPAQRRRRRGRHLPGTSARRLPGCPAAAHLLRRWTRFRAAGLHGSAVAPTFPQFRRTIASVSSAADAQDLYERYVVASEPRAVLLHAVRHRTPVRNGQPQRGSLLLVAGGKDELIRGSSIALLHREYRRRQPDAITDYKVFPGMDHTGSGDPGCGCALLLPGLAYGTKHVRGRSMAASHDLYGTSLHRWSSAARP